MVTGYIDKVEKHSWTYYDHVLSKSKGVSKYVSIYVYNCFDCKTLRQGGTYFTILPYPSIPESP